MPRPMPGAPAGDEGDAAGEQVGSEDGALRGPGRSGRAHAPSARAAAFTVNASSRRRNSGPCRAWSCAAPSVASTCSSAPTSWARTSRLIARTLDVAPAVRRAAIVVDLRVELRRVRHLVHQADGQRAGRIDRLARQQETERGADPDQPRQREGGAAVGDERHARECRGEAGVAGRDSQVARERQIEPEARGGALDHGEDGHRAAHDGEDGRLKIGEPMLQLGDGGNVAQPAEPMQVQSGREMSARAAKHHELRLARDLDLVQRLGEGAGERRGQRVATGGTIDGEPMDGLHRCGTATRRTSVDSRDDCELRAAKDGRV